MAAAAATAAGAQPTVNVVQPIRKEAIHSISLPATIEAFEKATLYSQVPGYLDWIKVDKGDRVNKGEVLAHISVPEVEQSYGKAKAGVQEAQAGYERAQANAKLKQLTFQRLKGIRDSQPEVISQQEVDVAEAEYEVSKGDLNLARAKLESAHAEKARIEAMLGYSNIRAPYDGTITSRSVDPGALIQNATSSNNVSPVVTVENTNKVRVYVSVPEPDVGYVNRGKPMKLLVDAIPARVFQGNITRFAGALDQQTRTMKTEIDLPNPDAALKPGMFGTATLELSKEPNALFLPSEAVRKDSGGKSYVFTVVSGQIHRASVETSLDDGKQVRVTGLDVNQLIVLSSTETLAEGMTVKTARANP